MQFNYNTSFHTFVFLYTFENVYDKLHRQIYIKGSSYRKRDILLANNKR